jgi:hypothetical protein
MFLRIARWVPANGILFAALVIIATFLIGDSPGTDSSDASWTSYYADAGNRHKEEISFFLIGVAGLCFLQFLGSLRGALARAEGEPARITTAAVASGVAFIAIAISAHAVGTVVSWTASTYGNDFTVDPNTARMLQTLSYLLFVMSLFAASAMALAVTTLAFVTRVFPVWLAWLGALATVAGIVGILFVPSLVVLAWIVAVSIVLLLPQRTAPGATATPV